MMITWIAVMRRGTGKFLWGWDEITGKDGTWKIHGNGAKTVKFIGIGWVGWG